MSPVVETSMSGTTSFLIPPSSAAATTTAGPATDITALSAVPRGQGAARFETGDSGNFFSQSLPLTWRVPQVPGNCLRWVAARFCIPVLTSRFYAHSPIFSPFSWKLTFRARTRHYLILICKALFQIHVLLFELFCFSWSAFWVSGLIYI